MMTIIFYVILLFVVIVLFLFNRRPCKQLVVVKGRTLDDPRIWDTVSKLDGNIPYVILVDGIGEDTETVTYRTNEDCKRINPLHESVSYSLESDLYILYEKFRDEEYDYVWLVEDDVYCDGRLDKCIEFNSHRKEDFLASFVEDYGETEAELNWFWWNHLKNWSPPIEQRVKSFFPVTRYSRRFLECVHDNVGKSTGYCEVYIPTLAKTNGYTYGNIENRSIGALTLGTIDTKSLQNNDNRLYHKWVL